MIERSVAFACPYVSTGFQSALQILLGKSDRFGHGMAESKIGGNG